MSIKNYTIWLMFALIITIIISFSIEKTFNANDVAPRLFVQNLNNNKFILVKGWNETQLKKILNDFEKIYQNQGYPAYSIAIKKEDTNQYELKFPNDIHPLLFIFLINYLAYPFDFDLKKYSITVAGETTLNRDYKGLNQVFSGQRAIFYIPNDDKAHDVVYMLTDHGGNLSLSLTTGYWEDIDNSQLNNIAIKLKNNW